MSAMSSAELHRLLAEAPLVQALARNLAGGDADDVAQEAWLRAIGQDAGAVRQPRSWLTAIVRRVVSNRRRERAHRTKREQVRRRGAHPEFGKRRFETDADGFARLDDVEPGAYVVTNVRDSGWVSDDVRAGEETTVDLTPPVGVRLFGRVVDGAGAPVGEAEVIVKGLAGGGLERSATTAADGRFELRACEPLCLVGARAPAHAASPMTFVYLQEGGERELRLVLDEPGRCVEGVVRDPSGAAVANAMVLVGEGSVNAPVKTDGTAPPPALVRTDDDGRFRAAGVPIGEQPVQVRAAWSAPWSGTCVVAASRTTATEVWLTPGLTCEGVVLDADGEPVEDAFVTVGDALALTGERARSGDDGGFVLRGLMPGALELDARHDRGVAHATVRGGPGETVRCELRLDRGLDVHGRVVDDQGPVVGAVVQASAPPRWFSHPITDAQGRFSLSGCPPDARLSLYVTHRYRAVRASDVDPRGGEIVIRLPAVPPSSIHLVGRVVGPDGAPLPQVLVQAELRGGSGTGLEPVDASDAFDFGPLPPGAWRVHAEVSGYPEVCTDWQDVVADETLDVGTMQLPVGGTLRVRLHGDAELRRRVQLRVWNDELTQPSWFTADSDDYRSQPLAPGRYHVGVYSVGGRDASPAGPGVAAQVLTVQVRAGESTDLDVDVVPGVFVRLEPDPSPPDGRCRLRIERDGVPVFVTGDHSTGLTLAFAPGAYTVATTCGGITRQTAFTVAAGARDEPLHVVTIPTR